MAHLSRLTRLKKSLRGIDALLITNIINVRYLTGFSGSSAFVLVHGRGAVFATDFRYIEQARHELGVSQMQQSFDIEIEKDGRVRCIAKLASSLSIKRLGVESTCTLDFFRSLCELVPRSIPVSGAVEKLRERKDGIELSLIKDAVSRAEKAFREVLPHIKSGVRESAIARRLEQRLKKAGCRRIPFDIIVASGDNSAMPHAAASEKKLRQGDLVTIDWGGEAGGYYSDMTRTLLIKGDGTEKKKKIYDIVLKANRTAKSRAVAGAGTRTVDSGARDVIKKSGYGDCFGHGTGHGVGIEVHELPRITRGCNTVIKEGMVFTIEPGIYVPHVGGVRIEDMVAPDASGAGELTSLTRELIEI